MNLNHGLFSNIAKHKKFSGFNRNEILTCSINNLGFAKNIGFYSVLHL